MMADGDSTSGDGPRQAEDRTMEDSKTGIVYIMRNPAFPKYVKIGMTSKDSVDDRVRSLSGTNVPEDFECLKAVRCSDARAIERCMHALFAQHRRKGEFFELPDDDAEEQAYGILEMLKFADPQFEDVTPAGEDGAAPELRAIRRITDVVNAYGLVGKTLSADHDESVKAVIHSTVGTRTRVVFGGEEMAISHATHLARREYHGNDNDSGGWLDNMGSWKVDEPSLPCHGKTIRDLRDEMNAAGGIST